MIYQITIEEIEKSYILQQLYENLDMHYYWSDDFSKRFYICLAQAGFINVYTKLENKELLLCEIQKSYAVLEFCNLHYGKSLKRLRRKARYSLRFNTEFNNVIKGIQNSYQDCWMVGKYAKLMQQLNQDKDNQFSLISCELFDLETNKLVAGEIGYFTANNVYTSLSGFSNKDKVYSGWGKLQMVLLAEYLQKKGIRFWNLGHPYMQYKLDLGATILQREEFLKIWYENI